MSRAPAACVCYSSLQLFRVARRTVAAQHRHPDSEDRLCAGCENRTRGARKRAPARQPAEQNPSPGQPDARRDETAKLIAAALAALTELHCLQSTKGSEQQCLVAGLRTFCALRVWRRPDVKVCSTRDGLVQPAMLRELERRQFQPAGLAAAVTESESAARAKGNSTCAECS